MKHRLGSSYGWLVAVLVCGARAGAEPVELAESPTDLRVFDVHSQINTNGKLIVAEGAGKTQELPIESQSVYRFRERRLPTAGRDALAYRAIREFSLAKMQAKVDGEPMSIELPAPSSLIVTSGQPDGLQSYSLRTLLTDDQVDLLTLLGDPLAVAAILPGLEMDVDSEWSASAWAAQLLTSVEAVENAQLKGRVIAREGDLLQLKLDGNIRGLQEGARTTVVLTGELTYDAASLHIRSARLNYKITAAIGAVAPGIDVDVSVAVDRQPTSDAGLITDALVTNIPLEAPPAALRLVFDAAPWKARFRYGRDWHMFRAVLEMPPKVAILRLIDQGSLVCQCNISPIPDAPAGQHTPLAEYQRDIQMVLGDSFRNFKSTDEVALPDGGTRMTVIAVGEVQRTGKDKEGKSTAIAIPMEWRYSIITEHSGRQMSFVFAVEQALLEQFADRDRELLMGLEYLR
ncbi:MAG: hypothetical protein ACK5Q5_19665 [Planctomycetaceae bacterium]